MTATAGDVSAHLGTPSNGVESEAVLRLRIERKSLISDGVAELVLTSPDGSALPSWAPGAHITLELPGDVLRQYSLCGRPTDGDAYTVAILREPEGRGGSAFVHDELNVGDELTVRPPRNHFPLVDAREYVFIAGGIGVTPMLPMIEEAERRHIPWRLAYGGRTKATMAYVTEIAERYEDRVGVHPFDEVGHIPLANLLSSNADVSVYCCGPEPLLKAVEDSCSQFGIADLHFERFSADAPVAEESDTPFEVTLAVSGQTLTVPVGCTILESIEKAGIPVDASCRDGTCGTCETGVIEGTPDHRDFVLTEEERAVGDTIFICVSRSCSPRLVLDV